MSSAFDKKKLPTILTGARIALSPLFFLLYAYPAVLGGGKALTVCLLWALFLVIELTDLLDGMAARKYQAASDFGKVFDPFADSFSRLSYFVGFTVAGAMPPIAFLLILYRDLLVSFGRLLMAKQGVSMSARLSGKIKAWVYAIAGIMGLVMVTIPLLRVGEGISSVLSLAAQVIFWVAAATAVWTAIDYLSSISAYLKKTPKA
jgi:CDP-diacylglycerol---glycerol-3-phosphate 3-phosphatidyltransferase